MKMSIFTTALILYFAVVVAIFLFQRKLLYLPETLNSYQLDQRIVQLKLKAWPNRTEYRGFTSQNILSDPKGTVVVFHGNAGSASNRYHFIEALENLGYRTYVVEYPGYGNRPGSISESTLVTDGIETLKRIKQESDAPLFLLGESLGTGVVGGIIQSKQIPVQGLLLISPYDRMTEIANYHYRYFLAKWLLLDKYDTLNNLKDYLGNTVIILAEQDQIIPNSSSLNLYQSISGRKKILRFQTGHNTLPLEPWQTWWQDVMQFLDH